MLISVKKYMHIKARDEQHEMTLAIADILLRVIFTDQILLIQMLT